MNELTREQILAMPAGRELDRLVALNVMGYNEHNFEFDEELQESYRLEFNEWLQDEVWEPFEPSQKIAAAWDILNKPEIMDHYQIGVHPTSFGVWVARPFMPGGKDCTVQDESGPLAICKCALLAVIGL